MAVDRVRVAQTGAVTGASTTTFYFTSATPTNLTALGNLFTALKPYYATTCTYTVPSSGDTVDETDGHVVGGWTAAAPAAIAGGGTSINSVLSGFFIDWKSTTVIDHHRPVGKTIIVPAASAAYTSAGFITPSAITAINAGAAAFLSATVGFVIWHRPVYDREVSPPALVRPGALVPPGTGSCNSKPTVLRSRRD